MISGGENNVVGDTLTFDGDIFGGGADLTCQVATTRKQTRGMATIYTESSRMCIINEQWSLGDDNKYYRLSGQRTSRHCVDWAAFTVAQVICGLGVVLQQVETEWFKHL